MRESAIFHQTHKKRAPKCPQNAFSFLSLIVVGEEDEPADAADGAERIDGIGVDVHIIGVARRDYIGELTITVQAPV